MAYDEGLSSRFRDALGPLDGLTEKRMMGGVCFMLHGNMIGGADRPKEGAPRFMFRVGKGNDAAAALPLGEPMEMGGRWMRGFFFVPADACDGALLSRWVELAVEHARGLPPK